MINMTVAEEAKEHVSGLTFNKFDARKVLNETRNFSMVITAKRRSGKSVFMKDICSQIKSWYNHVFVFSMTAEAQPDLFDYVPKDNVINSFDEAKLLKIWESQVREITRLMKTKTDPKKYPKILIIFDDIISDPKVRKSEMLKKLFVMGRHYHFAFIFISQGFKEIPPIMRKNVDVAVAFYLESIDDREDFVDAYLTTRNKQTGIQIFDRITEEPYQSIVILNMGTIKDPEQYVNTYIATLKVPKFKMGIHGPERDILLHNKARDMNVTLMPRIKKERQPSTRSVLISQ
jgi:hypothetical protein